ncbi:MULTISPECIES: ATP-binding protein [unclassified Oceanobacter]|uniref:ATP-binding protein n=1 Tax=unclassified Oceanobacter TaxID=2620260 RepID=UPI0026E39AF2|nr:MULTISPECIES: ATP-binding protein [unclassified Oceanobacter]MDO6680716.1 ATP-binding protein [Oceanobacter sp. 5_MG-2023]MDP2504485.1 ATP-binding protein [Oceanobacter sp. 3_MG-2023]MDP2547061.1 ATP-binding protein [Oceanobacter sp. 4_MG-2023]MDP2607885.1 ATP-binding protein [Oceanobacter sp. 1_MG-2023]
MIRHFRGVKVSWYRSLFFKVFVWFWLVIFLAMGLAVATRNWVDDDFMRPADLADSRLLLNLMEKQLPIVAEGRMLWRQLRPGWNLVSVPVDRVEELPHDLEEFADRAGYLGRSLYGQNDGWLMLGPVQSDGYLYIGVSRQVWQNFLDDKRRWVVPVVIVVVVTLLCFLLVWNLTLPMRRLQRVVRQMAEGNFDVTDLAADISRKDEIGVLVAEVASMADATQQLLASHQQLLRDVSHELRSPLTRLQIALGIARKKDQQQLVAAEHDRIERAAFQVENLISQILDLARLSQLRAGQLQLEERSPCEQVNGWLQDAELELESRHIKVTCDCSKAPAQCSWDWVLIERAVDNLLRNAIRYSPDGGCLLVEVAEVGDRVDISVMDQGPGVPDDMLESIFAPFTQVDHARSPGAGDIGYGLGLALVRRVVELHGGKVVAENRHPGLCVALQLPVVNVPTTFV